LCLESTQRDGIVDKEASYSSQEEKALAFLWKSCGLYCVVVVVVLVFFDFGGQTGLKRRATKF